MAQTVIAADLGGTHLRAALVDEAGVLRHRAERGTPPGASAEEIIAVIADLLLEVARRTQAGPVAAAIGTPGLINGDEGKVILAPNIPGFRDIALAAPLAAKLGIPVYIENDANVAALGEFRFGAGRGTRHLLHATLGTGIGGGIVIDGRLYRGARGFAGEIGHLIIDPAGPVCACGSRGCVEALVSGTAFAERARRLAATGKVASLAAIAAERPPTGTDLLAAANAGEALAEAEIRNGGHVLGLALGGLANVLNPDAITLSGGLLGMGQLLLEPMRAAMYSIAYGAAPGTPVRLTELDDDAGLLGAAAVAFERIG
jgi:glucokinase